MRVLFFITAVLFGSASIGLSAPYAAIVVNQENGKVLHCENCDMRLHVAGLTKLITLYIAFEAIVDGEVSLDDVVTISKKAAEESPVNLGLTEGQEIKLRYLIRAAGVMGANDASTAIAEHISGSEKAFAKRMDERSKRMGMTRSTWRNAHGLTQSGHLASPRDIAYLVDAHRRHFLEFFNMFTRRSDTVGFKNIKHSGSRYLKNEGVEFFKSGYTRAAGYVGAALTKRGRKDRVITVMYGGTSATSRNLQMLTLTDLGFQKLNAR